MKKVLIFMRENNISPKGGPAGYVYNLLKGIKKNEEVSFELLPSINTNKKIRSKYNSLPANIKSIYRVFGRLKDYIKINNPDMGIDSDYLKQFDAIHFHSCVSLYKNLNTLNEYKGIVILTTHSPKPPHIEKIEDTYSNFEKRLYGKKHLRKYEIAVRESFLRADYIIFPCKEAEESYKNNWSEYDLVRRQIINRIKYLPTGVDSCLEKIKTNRQEVRTKYKIPENAFVVSYVGRHNSVKGYDTLKRIAQQFSKKDNIYFLIAGEEAPLKRPDLDYWIEVGWTNDPYSLEGASDLFVLPNKETYFDLVLLEVLSIGINVLVTDTGGNKYFKQFDGNIDFFNGVEDAKIKIQEVKNRIKKNASVSKNRDLYLKYFTSDIFAYNYVKLINDIILNH